MQQSSEQQVVYNCSGSGGVANWGALGPFVLLILADNDLTELTPVYFNILKVLLAISIHKFVLIIQGYNID